MMNWQSAVERTVTGMGYDLVDAEKSAGGLLRVFIDHLPAAPQTGAAFITVDDAKWMSTSEWLSKTVAEFEAKS